MYRLETVTENIESRAKTPAPFGPGFEKIPEETETMEVWGSSFDDSGPDFCEFRLLDKEGNVLGTRRVGGY